MGGKELERKMPSQTPCTSDLPSFPHLLKFTTLQEIGGADGRGRGGDNFKSNLFCSGSKLSSKKKKKAISLQYTIVQTEATLLDASRNSADRS